MKEDPSLSFMADSYGALCAEPLRSRMAPFEGLHIYDVKFFFGIFQHAASSTEVRLKSMQILLSRTQPEPGRTGKQVQ